MTCKMLKRSVIGTMVSIGALMGGLGGAQAGTILFALPDNLVASDVDIFLTSEVNTNATITNTDGTFLQNVPIPGGGTAIVTITDAFRIPGVGTAGNGGFSITSTDPISAYLMDANAPVASNDITNLFPTESLGTDYLIMAGTSSLVPNGSQLSVVAGADSTVVTITPSANLTTGQVAGVPFNINLDELEAFELRASGSGDLTGTTITSTKDIGVFGGHLCGNVPASTAFCDHLIEQIPTTDDFGTQFVVLPTEQGGPGDVLKFLAKEDGTVITLSDGRVFNLDAGESVTLDGAGEFTDAINSLTSNKPILVGQFMLGSNIAGEGDPAFSLVPDISQWLDDYIFNTPAGDYEDYLGIAIEAAALATLTLDGVPVDPGCFLPVPGTTLVACNLLTTDGSHRITADSPFMLLGSGFNQNFASYFGIGGSALSGGGFVVPPDDPPIDVPEPMAITSLGIGLLGFGIAYRRRRKQ